MVNEASSQQFESIKENARLNSSVEKLRLKLKSFIVIDKQGELIGEVKDLILEPKRQINFVVSQNYSDRSSRLVLLISKLVQKIDPSNQSVIVDINKAEFEHFPEYIIKETLGMEIPEIPNSSVTPARAAVNEDTTKDSDAYSAVTPMTNTNVSSIDAVDIASTSYVASSDTQKQPDDRAIELTDTPEVLEEELIRLLGERLIVDRSKRKVGEVIVRKEIETRMVQVPVRREKLIVEQVSPERKQLAKIDLGQEEISAIELTEEEITGAKLPETTSKLPEIARLDNELTVRGEFSSPKIASLLLNAIALERHHGCKKVRVEIVVEDAEHQKTYQEWVERSGSNPPSS